MKKQPNEYEIVDYVWNTFKSAIGKGEMEQIGPLQMTTTEQENGSVNNASTKDVNELPDKMDKLVLTFPYIVFIKLNFLNVSQCYFNKILVC